jgi:hypothetical protein
LVGCALFDSRGQLIASHLRHKVVGENHVEFARLKQSQCLSAVFGLVDEITLALQKDMDTLADVRFVVHNQDVSLPAGAYFDHGYPSGKFRASSFVAENQRLSASKKVFDASLSIPLPVRGGERKSTSILVINGQCLAPFVSSCS